MRNATFAFMQQFKGTSLFPSYNISFVLRNFKKPLIFVPIFGLIIRVVKGIYNFALSNFIKLTSY